VPRSTDEDGRHASELTRLNAELARQHQEKSQLQAELDKLVKDDAAIVAALDRKIGLATAAVNELRHVRQTAADSNQMPSVCCPWCDCCIASKTERYPDLVNELVRLPVDVIVAGPAPAAVAAKKATS
jgi:hypothetical protein